MDWKPTYGNIFESERRGLTIVEHIEAAELHGYRRGVEAAAKVAHDAVPFPSWLEHNIFALLPGLAPKLTATCPMRRRCRMKRCGSCRSNRDMTYGFIPGLCNVPHDDYTVAPQCYWGRKPNQKRAAEDENEGEAAMTDKPDNCIDVEKWFLEEYGLDIEDDLGTSPGFIRALAAHVRKITIADCAKAVCGYCKDGNPHYVDSRGWVKHDVITGDRSVESYPCDAGAIWEMAD